MQPLDDINFITALDPKGMYRLTEGFPEQCRQALQIAQKSALPSTGPIQNVVLTGLGGSAAGGDFVRCLFDAQAKVPFSVNRDYHLANFVSESTLVFASSYSGNTEETLSAYKEAKERGAPVIAITSGGKLAEEAEKHGDKVILIPGGQPPRTALGFMFIPVVCACERLGFLPEQPFEHAFRRLDRGVQDWGVGNPLETNIAKQIGSLLLNGLGVIYGLGNYQGAVASRWKGQINENSKNLVISHTFPELNHNEILGWVLAKNQQIGKIKTLVLEDGTESAKMKTRADVTGRLIADVSEMHRVEVGGDSLLEKILAMALLGDFVSLYLAALNTVDPENIDAINILKAELSKVS